MVRWRRPRRQTRPTSRRPRPMPPRTPRSLAPTLPLFMARHQRGRNGPLSSRRPTLSARHRARTAPSRRHNAPLRSASTVCIHPARCLSSTTMPLRLPPLSLLRPASLTVDGSPRRGTRPTPQVTLRRRQRLAARASRCHQKVLLLHPLSSSNLRFYPSRRARCLRQRHMSLPGGTRSRSPPQRTFTRVPRRSSRAQRSLSPPLRSRNHPPST